MSFKKVYIHFVWTTKNKKPYLNTPELRRKVWQHIRENARKKSIHVDYIDGYIDHCHCLVSLETDQTMKEVMNLIKGESSFWINKCKLTDEKFEWQNDYYAVSVSLSMLRIIRNYIRNQELHHMKNTVGEELNEFLSKYGYELFCDMPPPENAP